MHRQDPILANNKMQKKKNKTKKQKNLQYSKETKITK